jgi:hypothetical protein
MLSQHRIGFTPDSPPGIRRGTRRHLSARAAMNRSASMRRPAGEEDGELGDVAAG